MKTHCDLCDKQPASLVKVYDSALETTRDLCPECEQRIRQSNEIVLRATLYGCAGVIIAFIIIVTAVSIYQSFV